MIELLYTTILFFVIFFPTLLCGNSFKILKIIIPFIQLIFSFIFFSPNFYKKHTLYKRQKMESTRYLDFYPIKSLYKTFYNNGTLKNISYERMHSNIYSFIETEDFPIKCLEFFFYL